MTVYSDFGFEKYEITFLKDKLETVKNLIRIDITDKFIEGSIRPEIAKLYVLKDDEFFRLVSTTFKPINEVLENDYQFIINNKTENFTATKNKTFELYIWNFDGLTENQIEFVCLELSFKIREKYDQWSLTKTKMPTENSFSFGKLIAKDAFNVIEAYKSYPNYNLNNKKISDRLFKEPYQYGLRGDAYLWKELKIVFENTKVETIEDFKKLLYFTFKNVTRNEPVLSKNYGVNRYKFGGMSSGMICSDFWLEKGFPLLIERYEGEKNNSH